MLLLQWGRIIFLKYNDNYEILLNGHAHLEIIFQEKCLYDIKGISYMTDVAYTENYYFIFKLAALSWI
jgi:hypothetical protein